VGAGDARGCLQAVKAGHAHVHHDDVGLELRGHGDGLQPVGGFADDRQAVVLQQATQRSAHGWGVIGDQHPWRQGRLGGWAGLLAHRRIVPGPVAGSRPARCRRAGQTRLLAGGCHADEVQAKQQGRDPKSLKIAMAFENDPFSLDVRDGVVEDAKRWGMQIVIDDKLPAEINDMAATLTKVKALKPDILVVSGHARGATLAVRQVSDMKVDVPKLLSGREAST